MFVTCAVYTAHYFIDTPFTAWLIPVTYTLSLVTSGRTLFNRQLVLMLMGLMLVLTSIVATYLAFSHFLLLAYLLFLIMFYMRYLHPHIGNTKILILFLFLTIVFANRTGQLESDLERASIIMLGVVMAMLAQCLFWRMLANDNIERAAHTLVVALRRLNHTIFTCLLSPDYVDNVYEYERRLHMCKRSFYAGISQLRAELPQMNKVADRLLMVERVVFMESVYENVMDYAQIRWRVEDHSSYALCASELRSLEAGVDSRLEALSRVFRNKPVSVSASMVLTEALGRMRSVYDAILNVSIQEPMAMLLFMASLHGLNDKLTEIIGDA